MAVQVFLEVIRLCKSFATDLAGERSLSGVTSHVFLQVAGLGERVETYCTLEPSLTCNSVTTVVTTVSATQHRDLP